MKKVKWLLSEVYGFLCFFGKSQRDFVQENRLLMYGLGCYVLGVFASGLFSLTMSDIFSLNFSG